MPNDVDDEVFAKLRNVYLFSEVTDRHLRKIVGLGKVVERPAGDELITQGRSAVGLHLILDGEAEVRVNEAPRRTVGPGDYVGEIAVIDGRPRSATVVATTQMRAWVLRDVEFSALLDKEASVAHSVLVGMCARLRELEGQLG